MPSHHATGIARGMAAAVALATWTVSAQAQGPVRPYPRSPAEVARADSGRPPFSAADVRFVTGMIPHHAQAVLIAGWAPSHGAGEAVRVLCERIVVAQRDEIAFMRRWLRDRGLAEPPSDLTHADHAAGAERPALMPGMLTAEQLVQLDAARGTEFDRLFLTFMIQHHAGAVAMVEQLMGSHGAAQDDDIFLFAADVNADQSTEIERMQLMLDAMAKGQTRP